MSKPEILQMGPYPEWDQAPLDTAYTVHRYFEASDRPALLAKVGPHVRAIATRGELGANAELIAACPKLEIISVYGVGFDAVHLDSCRKRGIHVTNTPDVLTKDVADLAIAMMLAQWRGVNGAERWVRDGSWAAKGLYPLKTRAWGKRAGVLGLGRIGFEVARRLAGFDMDIAYSDVEPKPHGKDWTFVADPVALAERSDVLFVTLAASAATRHIVGRDVLDALGPDGLLVNVSRASNIDEEALIAGTERRQARRGGARRLRGRAEAGPAISRSPQRAATAHHASARPRPARPWAN